ncbi:MAG: YHYH protein, partial [Alphaproteobacteria bacterium]|nr:YHYH protein [Alphaproteobacteria bacterium]
MMFKKMVFLAAVFSIFLLPPPRAAAAKVYGLAAQGLPLGDGRVSGAPQRGYVYACQTKFRGHGAAHAGGWIHGKTWDMTQKIAVEGVVVWPDAQFSVTVAGDRRIIAGNGLPIDAQTGVFPIRTDDPAYAIDRNPNFIRPQRIDLALPLHPEVAAAPSCVPMGMVGVMTNGVALFNALDAAGRDAVAHEVQDKCNGHPARDGMYHYHGPSPCVQGWNGDARVIGFALDGFPVTGMFDMHGRELTNKDLDACHGRVGTVMEGGRELTTYHYVMTREYPYSIGC